MKDKDNINLEKGLASKIYGLAYHKPTSGYRIAKIIGSQPHHVNNKIKKMHEIGALQQMETSKMAIKYNSIN